MKGMARVSFPGGGLIVPAHTPYDRELLFEHVEACAKQHGCVRLDWRHEHWTVSVSNGQREVCAACRRSLNNLTYRFHGHAPRSALIAFLSRLPATSYTRPKVRGLFLFDHGLTR